ncbi:MAG: signal peptidase I [Myxococcota bacterium]|nr:signal peptidase I [Myxococcota bacterium]
MAQQQPTRKARKAARYDLKQSRQLVKKYTKRLPPGALEALQSALSHLESALEGSSQADLTDAQEQLEAALDQHLGPYRKSGFRESVESIGLAILIALFLRTFVVEAFRIPSSSMIPTLAVGDFLFVNKLSYGIRLPFTETLVAQWGAPERGEVIVFVFPCNASQDYIKRVVGLPGDVVDVDSRGFVWINGEQTDEQFKKAFDGLPDLVGDDTQSNPCPGALNGFQARLDDQVFNSLHCGPAPFGTRGDGDAYTWPPETDYKLCELNGFGGPNLPPMPWKVPDGHVFVMGDNRGNSADSRYWGFVPHGAVKGKAMFIWMSWDGSRELSDVGRIIRWNRLFMGVHGQGS